MRPRRGIIRRDVRPTNIVVTEQDGVESGYALPLTDMSTTPLGNGVWSDTLPFTLGMNDVCPYQSVTYDPWILLPAYDENLPGNDGRDRMYSRVGTPPPSLAQYLPTTFRNQPEPL